MALNHFAINRLHVSTSFELAKSFKPGWWKPLEETYVTGTKADLMHCPSILQLEEQKTAKSEKHPHRFTGSAPKSEGSKLVVS